MNLEKLYSKALKRDFLSIAEGKILFKNAPTADLMFIGNELRKTHQPEKYRNFVGWIIDRNVNITNSCVAQCRFCNFYRHPKSPEVFVTDLEQYREKIDLLRKLGGNQLLLQGGLHPKMDLEYYKNLFSELKREFPDIKLHALGPAEIHHIAKLSKTDYRDVLIQLRDAGLDSLPGAGAEILSERVRKIVSKGKCSAQEWLDVMREAHKLKIVTSATMMFGHAESIDERMEHFVRLRELQAEKPADSEGFTSFIPWPFQDAGTRLSKETNTRNNVGAEEYVRMIALSRIMMPNIKNLQASWLTVGKSAGQLSLHAGANDFGSIMIEENVVSVAGADHQFNAEQIQNAIREAGFIPVLRNQAYEYLAEEETAK